jgi:phage-related protein
LNQLTQDDWDRTIIVIDRLASLGSQARMPLSRALGAGLYELRFTLGPTARRITYRFARDGNFVLLTTFRKQRSNETTEIMRARREAQACAMENP